MKVIGLIILQFCIIINSVAHGDLDERIAAKTAAIKQTPNVAQLYYERGYLYQQHEEFQNALNDYLKADTLGFKLNILPFRKAEVYLQLRQFQQGLDCTKICLQHDSTDIKIHKLRGEIFTANQQYDEAIQAYSYVLAHTEDLRPENYIQLSESYILKDSTLLDSAIWVLDKGLEHLGQSVFILQQQKLNYLIQLGRKQEALTIYDGFIASSKRKENWYYQKAMYLFQIGKYKAARQALDNSKRAFLGLHPRLQRTKAMRALKDKMWELEKALQEKFN